jgi:hypothetical protein
MPISKAVDWNNICRKLLKANRIIVLTMIIGVRGWDLIAAKFILFDILDGFNIFIREWGIGNRE